ncbi:hypothetical protein [Streptomyces phytohabitans]|uniref:hypothetical protein n=1 Tax=Streptomyces phytohabitans TaxID=1150371 RepID=UPI00345BB856
MGWTVLYIAFGVVALWLLGEVLLQYKARLRWRLVAFAGFATVVVGVVAMSSIPVITVGAVAFAIGQTFVTLSYRRGFSTGWALGGKPGSSRRRREGDGEGGMEPLPPVDAEPVLEVSEVETYAPQPMPDDTSEYGVYDRGDDRIGGAPDSYAGYDGYGQDGYPAHDQTQVQPQAAGGDEYAHGYGQQDAYATYGNGYGGEQPYGDGYGDGYGGGDVFGNGGGYDAADPYAANSASYDTSGSGYDTSGGGYGTQDGYGTDTGGYPGDGYGSDGYGTQYVGGDDPYAQQQPQQGYYADGGSTGYADGGYQQTPPGGVWMPQQRDPVGQQPDPSAYPYQSGYGDGGYDDGNGYGYDTSGSGYDTSGNGYPDPDRRGY